MTDNELNINSRIPFWSEDPNILFNPAYLFEIFPTHEMDYDQKLNAITRLILILSILAFMYTKKTRIIYICIITIASIYIVRNYDKLPKNETEQEKFSVFLDETNPVAEVIGKKNVIIPDVFDDPTPTNPFSNVDINMYGTEINKLPAPPAYNQQVNTEIVNTVKQTVRELNKDNTEISDPQKDRLFRSLGENLLFEQSLRPYYSMPNSVVGGDLRAFADYCYGSMISCKEGNNFACARNLVRHVGN